MKKKSKHQHSQVTDANESGAKLTRLPQSEFVWQRIAEFVHGDRPEELIPSEAPDELFATSVAIDLATCLAKLDECCLRGMSYEHFDTANKIVGRFNADLFLLNDILFERGVSETLHHINRPYGVEYASNSWVSSYSECVFIVAKLFYLLCLKSTNPKEYKKGYDGAKWPGPELNSLACIAAWEEIAKDAREIECFRDVPKFGMALKDETRKVISDIENRLNGPQTNQKPRKPTKPRNDNPTQADLDIGRAVYSKMKLRNPSVESFRQEIRKTGLKASNKKISSILEILKSERENK